MIRKHRKNTFPYPPLLIAILLGKDSTLCEKIVRVTSEPILVSIANIIYMNRKLNTEWFFIGFVPLYTKT